MSLRWAGSRSSSLARNTMLRAIVASTGADRTMTKPSVAAPHQNIGLSRFQPANENSRSRQGFVATNPSSLDEGAIRLRGHRFPDLATELRIRRLDGEAIVAARWHLPCRREHARLALAELQIPRPNFVRVGQGR